MKTIVICLIFCFAYINCVAIRPDECDPTNVKCGPPTLKIQQCPNPPPSPASNWSSVHNMADIYGFFIASGFKHPNQTTDVYACYTNESILFKFDLQDNNIYNPYSNCNDPVFYYDAVEVFISNGHNTPHNYIELDVSPNGVLFAANVINPNWTCAGIQDNEMVCNTCGLTWEAQRYDSQNYWYAYYEIPYTLIDPTMKGGFGSELRANLFRIDTPLNDPQEHSCWSPTYTNPPCFHKPVYFGYVYLV